MNKAILFIFAFVLAASLVFAQTPQAVHEPGTGIEDPELMESNQGTGLGLNDSGNQEMNLGSDTQLMKEDGNEKRAVLRIRNMEVHSNLNVTQEQIQNQTKIKVKLSNGRNAEVKVMPDVASQRALKVLGAKCGEENCSIELREVGQGNETKVAYQIQAQKEVKVLGLFRARMNVEAQIDAETGEVIKQKKAWWSFMARDSEQVLGDAVLDEEIPEAVPEDVLDENISE